MPRSFLCTLTLEPRLWNFTLFSFFQFAVLSTLIWNVQSRPLKKGQIAWDLIKVGAVFFNMTNRIIGCALRSFGHLSKKQPTVFSKLWSALVSKTSWTILQKHTCLQSQVTSARGRTRHVFYHNESQPSLCNGFVLEHLLRRRFITISAFNSSVTPNQFHLTHTNDVVASERHLIAKDQHLLQTGRCFGSCVYNVPFLWSSWLAVT